MRVNHLSHEDVVTHLVNSRTSEKATKFVIKMRLPDHIQSNTSPVSIYYKDIVAITRPKPEDGEQWHLLVHTIDRVFKINCRSKGDSVTQRNKLERKIDALPNNQYVRFTED